MVNVFALATCPKQAARMQCDAHVVKMLLELVQMLYAVWDGETHSSWTLQPYKVTHRNHPMTRWAGSCVAAYRWMLEHGRALCVEYTERYGKQHKCELHIEQLETAGCPPHLPEKDDGGWSDTLKSAVLAEDDLPKGCTAFPLCMGDHLDNCIVRNAVGKISGVASVRKYYKLKKSLFKKPFTYKKEEYVFSKWK